MVFSSSEFLFAFLPVVLIGYHLLPAAARNGWALLTSLLFYAFGAPRFVWVLIATCLFDWVLSRRLAAAAGPSRRRWLWLGVGANLALLGYCKYAGFFVAQVNGLLDHLGAAPIPFTAIALPIGISFFVFQKISYLVDVHRGHAAPASSPGHHLLYIAMFPQLIAGPIVRYSDVSRQLVERTHSAGQFWSGVERFSLGLFKKAVLANGMAALADPVWNADVATVGTAYAWLAVAAYWFQIWFDFSGYSDMAIGLGRMLGFEFLENFDRPYTARTFTEFWRRWHMSLSGFLRDYLYVPLGGNRRGPARTYLNLWIVFLASGLWHGAAWHFVAWGAWQGVFLTLDRLFWLRVSERLPALLLRLVMVPAVMLSWVLFRANDLPHAWAMYARLFGGGIPSTETPLSAHVPFDGWAILLLVLATVVTLLPWSRRYLAFEQRALAFARTGQGMPWATLATWLLFLLAVLAVVGGQHNPFIYYQF